MKVKELISELRKYDGDEDVVTVKLNNDSSKYYVIVEHIYKAHSSGFKINPIVIEFSEPKIYESPRIDRTTAKV